MGIMHKQKIGKPNLIITKNKEMKEKIFQKINEGLGKTALSERTIRSKAARLAAKIKTDEELTEDVLSDAVEDLRVLAGQLDHDVAEKVKVEAERKAAELLKSRNKQEKPDEPKERPLPRMNHPVMVCIVQGAAREDMTKNCPK